MKLILTVILFLVSTLAFNQDVKKIIDKNDTKSLLKYINEHEYLDEEIHLREVDYNVHPMVYASRQGRIEMIKLFVKNKDKIEDYNTIMSIAFVISIASENKELINYLYTQDPNVNEICEPCHGHTAIMVATAYGNEEWYFKLKEKSELKLISSDGNNLVHISCNPVNKEPNITIFNDLLTIENLDINHVNNEEVTPLHLAANLGNETQFFTLLENGGEANSEKGLYFDAIAGGNINIFKSIDDRTYLWELYDFPHTEESNEYYPIENAILSNSTVIVDTLFRQMFATYQNGGNLRIESFYTILNSRNLGDDYFFPLWLTAQQKNKELYKLILSNMVKFNELGLEYSPGEEELDEDYYLDAELIFKKFDYRSAKRNLGKEYIINLYKELKIDL